MTTNEPPVPKSDSFYRGIKRCLFLVRKEINQLTRLEDQLKETLLEIESKSAKEEIINKASQSEAAEHGKEQRKA